MSYTVPPVPTQEPNLNFVWFEWFRILRDRALATPPPESGTAPPTTGTYTQGDFVFNAAPTELGVIGYRYVIFGWVCVTGGTPGSWVAIKVPTDYTMSHI